VDCPAFGQDIAFDLAFKVLGLWVLGFWVFVVKTTKAQYRYSTGLIA
jgi:hypothetical protein